MICLLGHVGIDGATGPRGPLPLALLARLTLASGHAVAREDLIDDLWGTRPPLSAASALRVHVASVRRALAETGLVDALVTSHAGYRLEVDPALVDADVAVALVGRADELRHAARFDEALAVAERARALLAQAPLVGAADLLVFDAFRAHVGVMLGRARTCVHELHLLLGRGGDVVDELAEAAALAPHDERVLGLHLRALYQAGRHVDALERYRRHREALAERGLGPGPGLAQLESAILRHEPALGVRPTDGRAEPFVGRVEELAAFDRALAGASRRAGVVVVDGPAGIGKTRLVREWAARSVPPDVTVLWGACGPERAVPFEPFVGALQGRSDVLARFDRSLGADLDPDARRLVLFDAIVGAVLALVPERGVVVLDDVHWADPATVALVRHLVRAGRGHRVLLVLVARRPDGEGDQVRALAAELAAEVPVASIALEGLAPPEVRRLVTGLWETSDVDGTRLAQLQRLTDGNPLYVTEYARSSAAHPADTFDDLPVPMSLRHLLGRRFAPLADTTRLVLAGAAVLGRQFRLAHVAAVAGVDELDVLGAVEQAVRAGLLEATSGFDRFRFHHELLRRAALADLLDARRARLHLAAARAVEADPTDPGAPALALGHLVAAGSLVDGERVARAAGRAARQALAACAFEMAASFAAVGRARSVPGSPSHAELRAVDGVLASVAAQPAEAIAAFDEALALAKRHGLDDVVAFVLHAQQLFGRVDLDPVTVDALLRLAAAARARGDHASVLESLWSLSYALRHGPDRELARRVADEALDLAVSVGTPSALSRGQHAMHHVLFVEGAPVPRRLDVTWAGLAAADAGGDHLCAGLHGVSLVSDHMVDGRVDLAEAARVRLADVAAVARWPLGVWLVEAMRVSIRLAGDDLDGVEEAIGAVAADGAARHIVAAPLALAAQLFQLRWAQGRLAELEPLLGPYRASDPDEPLWAHAHALTLVAADREDEARVLFDQYVLRTAGEPWRGWLWLPELSLAASVCVAVGGPASADRLLPHLERHAGLHAVLGEGAVASLGPLDRVRGQLLTQLGRQSEARDLLAATVERCSAGGAHLWARLGAAGA